MIRPAAIIALCLACPLPAMADSARDWRAAGRPLPWYVRVLVIDVHDGDTCRVRFPRGTVAAVRLAGIDAPELDAPGGPAARRALRRLILHRTVRLEIAPGRDRYRRLLAHLYVGDTWVNRRLVRLGAATRFDRYSSDPRLVSDSDRHPVMKP